MPAIGQYHQNGRGVSPIRQQGKKQKPEIGNLVIPPASKQLETRFAICAVLCLATLPIYSMRPCGTAFDGRVVGWLIARPLVGFLGRRDVVAPESSLGEVCH